MEGVIELDAQLYSDQTEFSSEVTTPDVVSFHGEIQGVIPVAMNNYRRLTNKPHINGTELYDNYDEIDPTVPSWAKESNKPEYTAEEVGALDEDAEMSLTDVKSIWDMIFG